jgi:hypothetical protein
MGAVRGPVAHAAFVWMSRPFMRSALAPQPPTALIRLRQPRLRARVEGEARCVAREGEQHDPGMVRIAWLYELR